MKLPFKIGAKKTKDFFKKFPRAIGEHFLLSFIFSALIAFIIGGVIFYINLLERPVLFNVDVYKKVLEETQNREKVIQELDSKQFLNPFVPISNETSPSSP